MAITEIGTLSGFVALSKPSFKFKEGGEYSCKLTMEGAVAKRQHANLLKLAPGVNVQCPWTYDGVDLEIRFKQAATITSKSGEKFEKEVRFFDAKGQLITKKPNIAADSEVRINFKVYEWNYKGEKGLTLQPMDIQIIKLVEFEETPAPKPDEDPFSSVSNQSFDDIEPPAAS